jgi:hypothetical protein
MAHSPGPSTGRSPGETSQLTKAYLIAAPLPLTALAALAMLLGVGFDRCQKNCVAPESAIFIPVFGFIVGAVLLAAVGTAIAAWRSTSQRQLARTSFLLAVLGLALGITYWAIFISLSVEATT